MLEKHQFTGPNFNEWFRALKLVVRTDKLHDVFETALPPAPVAGADAQALADWAVLFDRHNEVAYLMLGTMSSKLYQQFEHNSPLEMPIVGVSSTPQVMTIQGGRVQKYNPQEEGHWKRNGPVYLAELIKKKKKTGGQNVASTSSGLCCEAHVKRHTPNKLQQRSVKCIFVGYPKETIGYYFYYPPENKIVVERYADFLEKDFILQKESGRIVELEDEDSLPSENASEHPIEE
nr:zinc finger, CCHC-type [Tanacetum cinerariifolium]